MIPRSRLATFAVFALRGSLAAALAAALSGCGDGSGSGAGAGAGGQKSATSPPAAVWFQDVTKDAAISFRHRNGATGRKYLPEIMSGGACALDFDVDGRIDVFFVQSGPVPGDPKADLASADRRSRLYRNLGGGAFADVTESARIPNSPGYGCGAVSADYDNDGFPDLFIAALGRNTLLKNRGDGTFEDVTERALVGDAGRWASSACFFDADDDGLLDLYVANYVDFTVAKHKDCGDPARGRFSYCHPDVYAPSPDVFFRNKGGGVFEDATAAFGFRESSGAGLGVVSADFDADGRPDVYVANDSNPSFLFKNLGGGKFTEIGAEAGVAVDEDGKSQAGMGVAAGDVDADGDFDLFVTYLNQQANGLFLNGPREFTYASRTSGLFAPTFLMVGFGTDFFDAENDGDLDIFIANGHVLDDAAEVMDASPFRQPCQLLLNDGRGRFTEVSRAEAGPVSIPRVGRGTVTLDFDDDGRLDQLVQYNDDDARLFRNVRPSPGRWIKFSLQGTTKTRDAVGARVTIESEGRSQVGEKRAGGSYQCSHDPRLHFGLGTAASAVRATIRWPGGAVQSASNLAPDRLYRWTEGRDPEPLR